jgi:hypothetical protein
VAVQTEFVLVQNVRAISDGLGLVCELANKRRFNVPVYLIAPESQVRRPGDVGTLALPQWFADYEALPVSK